MGEFGAVTVVSGKVFGQTDTLSLAVESLYESYEIQAAFAVASSSPCWRWSPSY